MKSHSQTERFRRMHTPGRPLVLFNVWDAGSAKAVEDAGASALATGSWSVAAANGYLDGEKIPLTLALENVSRIVAGAQVPVSFDIESGYGDEPSDLRCSVAAAAATGVVGFNIEDSVPATGSLRAVQDQVARLKIARQSADGVAGGLFLNARTDVFLQAAAEDHDQAMLEEAIARGKAFADAGADGLFVPGLASPRLIERLTRASSLPVNIMVSDARPADGLASLGVARISYGSRPYETAMRALSKAARAIFATHEDNEEAKQ